MKNALPSKSTITVSAYIQAFQLWFHLFFLFSFSLLFLNELAKVISNFFPIAALTISDQDRSYVVYMPCVFKPCPWEVNSNGGLKRQHLKSSSSPTKNIISALMQNLWIPHLAGLWLTMRGFHSWSHMTLGSRGKTKVIISLLSECLWPLNLTGW